SAAGIRPRAERRRSVSWGIPPAPGASGWTCDSNGLSQQPSCHAAGQDRNWPHDRAGGRQRTRSGECESVRNRAQPRRSPASGEPRRCFGGTTVAQRVAGEACAAARHRTRRGPGAHGMIRLNLKAKFAIVTGAMILAVALIVTSFLTHQQAATIREELLARAI